MLDSPLIPALMFFVSISMATYVVADFIIYVSNRYRDRYLQEVAVELDDILIQMPAGRIHDLTYAICGVGFLLMFLIYSYAAGDFAWKGGTMCGLVVAVLLFPIPRLILRHLRKRRLQRFNAQLEDVLGEISSALKAGFSINQALEEIAGQNRPPISVEFRLLTQEIQLGVPLEQAMENMNRRLNSEDFELVATAIITARQTGGELTGTLERLASLIRERMRINNKLRAMTAMGRLQAILISLMPAVLLIGMYFLNPALVVGMFESPLGIVAVVVAVLLQIAGFFVIKKITTIEV